MSEDKDFKWLPIDTESIVENKVESRNGVEIQIGMSPFDVPEKIRGRFHSPIKKFIIEFEYLDADTNEEHELIGFNEHFEAEVGSLSGRIYKLFVDVKSLDVQEVRLRLSHPELESAFKNLKHRRTKRRRRIRNAETLRKAVEQKSEKMLSMT